MVFFRPCSTPRRYRCNPGNARICRILLHSVCLRCLLYDVRRHDACVNLCDTPVVFVPFRIASIGKTMHGFVPLLLRSVLPRAMTILLLLQYGEREREQDIQSRVLKRNLRSELGVGKETSSGLSTHGPIDRPIYCCVFVHTIGESWNVGNTVILLFWP